LLLRYTSNSTTTLSVTSSYKPFYIHAIQNENLSILVTICTSKKIIDAHNLSYNMKQKQYLVIFFKHILLKKWELI